jgi:nicotinate-nucleotide pyrophosphorylase (carboxylating)
VQQRPKWRAATGVDLISIGWLTHSATVLDIGLDYAG